MYTHGEVAALRDALQEGLSISSAVSRAREALSADTGARLWDVQITNSPFSSGVVVTPERVFHAIGQALEVRALKTGELQYVIGKR